MIDGPVQRLLHDLVEARVASIIQDLVIKNRNQNLDPQFAVGEVSAIRHLRALEDDLASKLKGTLHAS